MTIYPSEHTEQAALVSWAKTIPFGAGTVSDYLAAIPNGAALSKRSFKSKKVSLQALRLKAEGLKPGVPDLMLLIPTAQYHGLFIEMKRAKKSLSRVRPEQLEWQQRLQAQGYRAEICYGFHAARKVISEYLGLPPEDESKFIDPDAEQDKDKDA